MKDFVRRNKPVIPLLIALLLFGLYSLYWRAAFTRFKASVEAQLDDKAGFVSMTAAARDYSGYPFRLQVDVQDAQIVRQKRDYVMTVRAPRMRLVALPWNPALLKLFADKPETRLRFRNGATPLHIGFQSDTMDASLRFRNNGIERLSFAFAGSLWDEGLWLASPVRIPDLQFHLWSQPDDAAQKQQPLTHFNLTLNGITRAAPDASPRPSSLVVTGLLTGKAEAGDFAPSLRVWQQQGGTLKLQSIEARGDGLSLTGDGQLSLDESGRIRGEGTLMTNAGAQLSALAQDKALPEPSRTPMALRWKAAQGMIFLDDVAVAPLAVTLFGTE